MDRFHRGKVLFKYRTQPNLLQRASFSRKRGSEKSFLAKQERSPLADSRIERQKLFFEAVVVCGQVIDSVNDGGEPGGATGDAGEGFFETFKGSVGCEPVFGFEKGNQGAELRSKPFGAAVEELVVLGNEVGDGAGVILVPVFVEKVVEEDVDDDAGEAKTLGCE